MSKTTSERSRMLGTMPMMQLVPKISIPIMISMLVQALYNVVDSIFVARFDANALTAVSLAMPVQMLMIAVFDVQGWCSLLFVVCVLAGMEMAVREPRGRALTEREGI